MNSLIRHPIGDMTADAIMDEFAADAAGWQATPVPRFVAGLERVATLRRYSSAEDAFQKLLDRVQTETGSRRLPLTR